MGLTVETGQGLADADAYLSVEEADAYHAAHSASSTWSGAITANKEKAIRLATQFLDIRYGARWCGTRASVDQALDWPRASASDSDGNLLGSTVIPRAVKHAAAEAALRCISSDLMADQSNPSGVKRETTVVGPIETTVEYAMPNGPAAEYPVIDGLLRKIANSAGQIRRS